MRLATITPGHAGNVELRVYEVDHEDHLRSRQGVRASSQQGCGEVAPQSATTDRNPKTAGLALKRRLLNSSDSTWKFPGGITPRNFQLLMAEAPTPVRSATAAVPPRASTMSSTELSITHHSSRSVKMSRLHIPHMDLPEKPSLNKGMDSPQKIGQRLGFWLKAEIALKRKGEDSIKSAADLCRFLNIGESAWSQYKKGKIIKKDGTVEDRPITLEVADQLCHHFDLTLDWIYRNDVRNIPMNLQRKLGEIERHEAAVNERRSRIVSVRDDASTVAPGRREARKRPSV